VSVSDIKNYLNNAHIYLQTSYAEGFSNACLEAQAFGLPCIVPAISGMSECIEDGRTGIIVKKRTEFDFADAVIELIENITDYDANYISKRVKTNFNIEIQRKAWLNFFDLLIP
jgi:glycosyltransferase involved in cell wall biosynthesis